MQKVSFLLILALLLFCGTVYSKESKPSFTDRLIQAATEKDPKERFFILETLMAGGNEYERLVTRC